MSDPMKVRAGRRTVEVHRPEKVLFPAKGAGAGTAPASGSGSDQGPGLTKADLVEYYRSVAEFMLPELKGRPLMLERHPDGLGGLRFMQKNTPDGYPDWIHRAELAKKGGTVTHAVCDDTATLVYLADQACLTFHRWQSRAEK